MTFSINRKSRGLFCESKPTKLEIAILVPPSFMALNLILKTVPSPVTPFSLTLVTLTFIFPYSLSTVYSTLTSLSPSFRKSPDKTSTTSKYSGSKVSSEFTIFKSGAAFTPTSKKNSVFFATESLVSIFVDGKTTPSTVKYPVFTPSSTNCNWSPDSIVTA